MPTISGASEVANIAIDFSQPLRYNKAMNATADLELLKAELQKKMQKKHDAKGVTCKFYQLSQTVGAKRYDTEELAKKTFYLQNIFNR